MMLNKAVIIPDSFKGTLSSVQVCEIIEKSIKAHFPECETLSVPFSDGGEGFAECMTKACGGKMLEMTGKGPFFEDIKCRFGLIDGGKTAVIETAEAAGITLAAGRLDPEKTTTYGVGLMIKQAYEAGCRSILLGLGGSCTNDGGCGAAAALGARFFTKGGKEFIPVGGTLEEIERIELSQDFPDISITAMCDVDSPLYGENGAAYIFAPQKGASPSAVKRLDKGLRHLADKLSECIGRDVSGIRGGGAAGGLGAGVCAFMKGTLKGGTAAVLEAVRFREIIKGADIIFTGEGKIDSQSARGKVISGVASASEGIPVIAFTGGIDGDISALYKMGLTAAFAINTMPEELASSAPKSAGNLEATADNVMRLLSC